MVNGNEKVIYHIIREEDEINVNVSRGLFRNLVLNSEHSISTDDVVNRIVVDVYINHAEKNDVLALLSIDDCSEHAMKVLDYVSMVHLGVVLSIVMGDEGEQIVNLLVFDNGIFKIKRKQSIDN